MFVLLLPCAFVSIPGRKNAWIPVRKRESDGGKKKGADLVTAGTSTHSLPKPTDKH